MKPTDLESRVSSLSLAVSSTLFALLAAALVWAYWPGLAEIVAAWNRDPDYSHGYIVMPIALYFLWSRREQLQVERLAPSWGGVVLLSLVAVVRYYSGKFYLGPVDAWSIPLALGGIVLLCFGRQCFRWCLPSVAFLYFMIPLPYSAETWLSVPLQRIATGLSTEMLQLIGIPALAEGNVIWIGERPLMVAEACSGLRILVGIFALAFAFVLFSGWAWWQKVAVVLAAVPVAILANSLRIVVTALLQEMVSGEVAHRFSHDLAGFVMIPLAGFLFWAVLAYLDRLFPVHEVMTSAAVVKASRKGR
ncbi:exosortase/archaeosortase family protein [Posidoniimonas corsicana]|nr:exosortase/archaeosortase family protein [Posidoniimonas corsicana]